MEPIRECRAESLFFAITEKWTSAVKISVQSENANQTLIFQF